MKTIQTQRLQRKSLHTNTRIFTGPTTPLRPRPPGLTCAGPSPRALPCGCPPPPPACRERLPPDPSGSQTVAPTRCTASYGREEGYIYGDGCTTWSTYLWILWHRAINIIQVYTTHLILINNNKIITWNITIIPFSGYIYWQFDVKWRTVWNLVNESLK